MQILKDLLLKRRGEQAKHDKKNSSFTVSTLQPSSAEPLIRSSLQSTESSIVVYSSEQSMESTGSLQTADGHKQRIIHLVNEWCTTLRKNDGEADFHLQEGTDYEIIITLNPNKAFVKCKCSSRLTLGQKDDRYMVSSRFIISSLLEKPLGTAGQACRTH